jgi:hypothetical protein
VTRGRPALVRICDATGRCAVGERVALALLEPPYTLDGGGVRGLIAAGGGAPVHFYRAQCAALAAEVSPVSLVR